MPSQTWTNVFHFTASSNNDVIMKYGDRTPALWINKDGYFMIISAINDNFNYFIEIKFEVGKQYKMIIKQYEDNRKYWYEIITDGNSTSKIQNTQAKSFSHVKLYASNPWQQPFSSDFGKICNVNIQSGK